MEKTLTALGHVMTSALRSQGLALEMLDRFFDAIGSLGIEFDAEFKTFSSWRSKGISHLNGLETVIARRWLDMRRHNVPQSESDGAAHILPAVMDRWRMNGAQMCIAAYIAATGKQRPTAWCVLLPEHRSLDSAAELTLFEKLVEPVQTVHDMTKGFIEVAAHGVLTKLLADASPWGLVLLDAKGVARYINAQARAILERNNGVQLIQGKIKLNRSAADRALQCLIERSLTQQGHADGSTAADCSGIKVVPVPGNDGKVGYAIEVRPFVPMGQGMQEPSALLLITDLDRTKSASGEVLAKVFSLSERESQFAEVFGKGYKLQETAKLMQISPNTARVHLQHILRKTGTQNQIELARVLSRLPQMDE